jgi:hypothetical protein
MALLASNFAANSLSGNVVVINGQANINLGAINYTALDGTKTIYVKLRKYSNTGALLGVSNAIVIPNRTGIVSLVANVSTVTEKSPNIVSYTVTTANVIGNVTLNWSTIGTATGPDFIANTGTVLISNNSGSFAVQISADLSGIDETGEYYGIQLSPTTGGQVGNVIYATSNANAVTILDTSKAVVINSIESNVLIMPELGIVSYSITTSNAGNVTLYYSTIGSLTNAEIITANTGSFTPTSDSNTTIITLRVGSLTADPRNVKLQIRDQSPVGNIRFTGSNVFIYRNSINEATGGIQSNVGGYRIHTFTTTGNFVITSGNATIELLVVGGGGSGGTGGPTGISAYMGGGGGGAGGILYTNSLPVSPGTCLVLVGGGGTGLTLTNQPGNTGGSSSFNTPLSSFTGSGGGGGGAQGFPTASPTQYAKSFGKDGGSGGGGGGQGPQQGPSFPPGSPNSPGPGGSSIQSLSNPGFPPSYNLISYGYPGGTSFGIYGSGGGGAGGAGIGSRETGPGLPDAGNGGIGIINPIVGSTIGILYNGSYYIGGGGGGARDSGGGVGSGLGGLGGGGDGGGTPSYPISAGVAGNVNTGGGGGGGVGGSVPIGSGGPGVVILRYVIPSAINITYKP